MIIAPPSLPYQASGVSFVTSRRLMVATTFETPIALFTTTSKMACWNARNSFCWAMGQYLVLSAYASPTFSDPGQPAIPVNLRIGSSTQPTVVSSNDPVVSDFGVYMASLKVSSTPTSSALLMVLDPGQSLLITATASTDNVDIGVGFSWYELDA